MCKIYYRYKILHYKLDISFSKKDSAQDRKNKAQLVKLRN